MAKGDEVVKAVQHPVEADLAGLARLQGLLSQEEAAIKAAQASPAFVAKLEEARHDWLTDTGQKYPESVEEVVRQGVLSGINPNLFLGGLMRLKLETLETLQPVIHGGLQRMQHLAPKNAIAREYSKPLRVNNWHRLFVKARYSENESERSFRKWMNEQIEAGDASRKTPNGPVCFCLNFLKVHQVELPSD